MWISVLGEEPKRAKTVAKRAKKLKQFFCNFFSGAQQQGAYTNPVPK
jgi:hypothetical protein